MESEFRPIAEKRYHRIIVNVTDDEIADNMLGSAMSTMLRPKKTGNKFGYSNSARIPSKNINADIDVLNCTTLSLNQKNHQNPGERTNHIMFFDCVGRTESDPLVRYELGNMFDLLMIDRRNCCLVNFKPIRERPTNFFNNVLVPEVEKRLMMLQGTMALRSIKLEYYDVQKYDVINMCNSSGKKSNKNELMFQNTRELLRWTQRTYPNLWVNGSEHDCFDLEFVFIEGSRDNERSSNTTKVSVKLSILQFYLNKMDGDLRVGLRNFLENVNQTDLRMKHSILTDYLREYFFNEEDSWQIWMLFDVPSVNFGSSLANDMLTLASAAYIGVHDTNMLINNSELDMIYKSNASPRPSGGQYSVTSITSTPTSTFLPSCSNQKSKQQHQQPPPPQPTNTTSTSSSNTISNRKNKTKIANYSLSFWYCRIDESFVNVMTSLERYYDRKYELKVQKLCGDLKRMTRNIDGNVRGTNQATIDDTDIESDAELQKYFKQYKEALTEFNILTKKIERTRYANQLNAFVKTKNVEISKQTRQMKVRLLELCQAKISNTIKDEVKTLNTEKDTISNVSNELTKSFKSR